MARPQFDGHVLTDISWWHWTLTIPLLVARLSGVDWALPAAAGLCAAAGGYFWLRLRQVRPYPVQVRIAYLGLLAIGASPAMQWIHWVQLCGTTAMVTVGYCPLIRMLSVLPWNSMERFSVAVVWRAFVRQPCSGGLITWPAPSDVPTSATCGLPSMSQTLSCSLPQSEPVFKEQHDAQAY